MSNQKTNVVEEAEINYEKYRAMELRGQIGIMSYFVDIRVQELLEEIEGLGDQRNKNKLIAELRSVRCAFIK